MPKRSFIGQLFLLVHQHVTRVTLEKLHSHCRRGRILGFIIFFFIARHQHVLVDLSDLLMTALVEFGLIFW